MKRRWLALALMPQGLAAQTLPPVTVTGVYADTNSAKIKFLPVPGALDYRVYDVSTPMDTSLGSWPDGNRYDAYDKYIYTVGHGLDNRSRFDVFVSETKIAIFEDGRRVSNDTLTIPIDYAAGVKIYFPHYLYHTANEINDLITYSSYQTFWINDVPYSDERHWNNMGFEVLPASVAWGSLGRRIVMPAAVAP